MWNRLNICKKKFLLILGLCPNPWLVLGVGWLCEVEFLGLRFLVWIPSFFILRGRLTWNFITEKWMKIILKTDNISYIYQRFFLFLLLPYQKFDSDTSTPDKLIFWNNWDTVYHLRLATRRLVWLCKKYKTHPKIKKFEFPFLLSGCVNDKYRYWHCQ